MGKFKVGDKVRVTDAYPDNEEDCKIVRETGKIISKGNFYNVEMNNVEKWLEWTDDGVCLFTEEELELVNDE